METITFSQVCSIVQFFWLPSILVILASIRWVWKQIQPISTKYFEEKVKNLAQKQDLDELTKIVESVKLEFQEKLESIRKQHTLEIEQYKAQLEQVKLVGRVQFEKEFQIYELLWKALVRLRYTINCIEQESDGLGFSVTSEEREQRNQNFIEAANAFYFTIEENMPFYEREIYNELTKISQIGAMKIVKVTDPSNHPPTTNIEKAKFVNDVINSKKNLLEVTNNIAYKIRDRIENIKVIDSV